MASELQTVTVEPNTGSAPFMATVPDGVAPGGLFHISTPSGAMMSVTCPPTSKPGDTIQVMVPLPTGPPALLGVVEKESHVTFGREVNAATVNVSGDWISRGEGWRGEVVVKGSSGTKIGTLQYTTDNVLKAPCNVQLVSPEGHVLLQYQLPDMKTWLRSDRGKSASTINVTMGGVVYASCSFDAKPRPSYISSGDVSVTVTRADGSGGTLVAPLVVCGTAKCNLTIIGFVLFVLAVGMVCLCLAHAMPVTGSVKSLDGSKEFAPHGLARGIKTINFVPDDKDKRKDEYAAYDAKDKLDAFVGISMTAVAEHLAATQDG